MVEIKKRIEQLSALEKDPKKHLLYYRHALADSERMDINANTVQQKGGVFPHGGKPSDSLLQKLFTGIPKETTSLEIFYCPLAIHARRQDGISFDSSVIYPYWIPAVVDRSGGFGPQQKDSLLPWLIRGVLAPNDYQPKEYPVLSTVEKVDQVGTKLQLSRDSWTSYLEGALAYFQEQVGQDISTLSLEGWAVSHDQIAVIPAELKGTTHQLIQVCDHFLERSGGNLPGTLSSLLLPRTKPPLAVDDPDRVIVASSHHGQMANRFPLSPSQRVSLALFNSMATHQVFAVNGPPGTGKTTLIQSIVADVLVKAFLSKGKPPVIVGTSVNNKAITNILDSFASVTPSESLRTGLNERWLPHLEGLGHYLKAQFAETQDQVLNAGYWVSTPGSNGDDAYHSYCSKHSKTDCELYFISKFLDYSKVPQVGSLEACAKIIKENVIRLTASLDKLSQSIKVVRDFIAQNNWPKKNIATLGTQVDEKIAALESRRAVIDALIEREHLPLRRPWFLVRWIERLRFGHPQIRWARIQSELLTTSDSSFNFESSDFYGLAKEVWKFRRHLLQEKLTLYRSWREVKPDFERLMPYFASGEETPEWIEQVQNKLDLKERHEAFWWALHGFECQWLLQRSDEAYAALNSGQAQSTQRWEQRSYLTPVFVSTLFSVPNFFSYTKKTPQESWLKFPLTDCIDLLIVDEAGQVAPELGVPVFGLAKKALVVGDVRQLEPIWSLPAKSIDFANSQRAGLVNSRQIYEECFENSQRSSANGSLMVLAQDASAYLYPPHWKEAGSLLVEHRRCVPDIIEFCNRFVYESRLDIKTKAKESLWPALGYCHIGGESKKEFGSQSNPIEAQAIATWIQKNKEKLVKKYQTDLSEVIAIVTPFKGQKTAITKALKDMGVEANAMVVGTVHSLQGAERAIVIFSPVYGRNHQSTDLFFNQTYNMLNVAVSRAKDHFFVFGNMSLFSPASSNTPASNLGQLLFKAPSNELLNDFIFEEPQIPFFEQEPIDRLDDLSRHRKALKRAFEIATTRLVIVSPFISQAALQADSIAELVQNAVQRQVEVLIYTDAHLDIVDGKLKQQAAAGRKTLEDAGAKLKIVSGIHNKTLIIDRQVFIEGSFNWLSAVRDESSPYHRHETSLVIKAPSCERFILRAENELGLNSNVSN